MTAPAQQKSPVLTIDDFQERMNNEPWTFQKDSVGIVGTPPSVVVEIDREPSTGAYGEVVDLRLQDPNIGDDTPAELRFQVEWDQPYTGPVKNIESNREGVSQFKEIPLRLRGMVEFVTEPASEGPDIVHVDDFSKTANKAA